MNLALFDFDGTITTRDSLPDFIQFAVGKPAYYFGLVVLSPVLIAYLGGLVSNQVAKQKLLAWFFKGWQLNRFQSLAEQYSRQRIDEILRPEAMEKLRWHQQRGDRVIVVSASIENWLADWCENQHLELLATSLATLDGKLTGEFATANCHGIEKSRRICELLNLDDYKIIYAYGDSNGDTAMLGLAHEAFYRQF